MLRMLWGRKKAESSRLVGQYQQYRAIAWDLNNKALLEYLSRAVLTTAGKRLGMLRKNTLLMDHEDEIGLVMDYATHDVWERGGNAVSRYRADVPPDPRSDEYAVVKALSESFCTLIEVVQVLPRVGVRVADQWADREDLLLDMGFSRTARKRMVLATRIFPFEEFVTTSGAALPVDAELLREIQDSILPRYKIEQEGRCTLAGGRRKVADLTAAVIRLCLQSGASDRIQYEPVVAEPGIVPRPQECRIDRNAPCPCGSRRKYKQCCGRTRQAEAKRLFPLPNTDAKPVPADGSPYGARVGDGQEFL